MSSIGARNKLIEIRTPTAGVEPTLNQPIETWTVFTRAWARKAAHSGREFYQAQQRHAEITEIFNIHYFAGITSRMRVVCAGVTYEIIDVDDSSPAEINLFCKAAV